MLAPIPSFLIVHAVTDDPVTRSTLLHQWGGDPGALISILGLAVLYGIGVHRLWLARGRYHVVSRAEVIAFYAGIVTLLVALCSPIDALADTLFSAHMIQHVLLITVAAPLAVLGALLLPLLWSLPRSARVAAGRSWNALGMRRGGAMLVRPVPAWTLHTIALWGWHLPGPYSAALASAPVHALEHISFYVTALLVWWTALAPLRTRYSATSATSGIGASLFVLIGTLIQSSALGAILTFSGTPWYGAQSAGAVAWNLTPLEDQQVAGLIMWIPASFFYLAGILAVMHRILQTPSASPGVAVPSVKRAATSTMVLLLMVLASAAVHGCSNPSSRRADRVVPGGNPDRGRTAIQHFGCGACHAIPGIRTAVGAAGPPLAGVAGRTMIAGIAPNNPDMMVRWIMLPQSMAPGNAMPDLGVSEAQARDIAAYLYTLH
jgi:putative membrane protein